MAGVVVQLQTSEAKLLGQDTTDGAGKFNPVIPDHPASIRVHTEVELPAQETQNDIHLVRLPMVIGVSDAAFYTSTPLLATAWRVISWRRFAPA
jgi:hypothetical protein